MAQPARSLGFPARSVSNETLMRMLRFPAVRSRISEALARAVPEKVDAVSGRAYVRFRLADPSKFHPALMATIPVGSRGTLLVIGTPRSAVRKPRELEAFIRRMGRGMKTEARRSLIYQLRNAGIIGGAETQAVLVPRERVLSVARTYAGGASSRAAANPILATIGFNPGTKPNTSFVLARGTGAAKRYIETAHAGGAMGAGLTRSIQSARAFSRTDATRVAAALSGTFGRLRLEPVSARSNPLTRKESAELAGEAGFWARRAKRMQRMSPRAASYFAGRARGSVDALKRYGVKRAHRVAEKIHRRADDAQFIAERMPAANRNPGASTVEIKVPFRDGQKITPARMREWVDSLPVNAITRLIKSRFEKCITQYKRFHMGSEPTSFTYRAIPMGSQGSRITDVDMVVSEGKEWAAPYQVPKTSGKYDPNVQGRYIHAHGESKMDVDIKKAASTAKLPERFHTADGKFVGVVPSRNVKITDWYRG